MKKKAHPLDPSLEDLKRQQELPITSSAADTQKTDEGETDSTLIKAAFLSGISHELKTPLNAILGFSELGQQHTEDPLLGSYFENIASSGKALLGMITDLLDMASAKEGKYVPSVEVVDIDACLKEAIHELPASLIDSSVPVTLTNIGTGARFFELDQAVLTRVIRRLVSNGLRYTEKGHVAVTYWVDHAPGADHMLRVRVKDTGIGIPPHLTTRVFEVFEPSAQKAHRGPGLGLPLVKALLDAIGGQVRVESSSKDGTSMLVDLPARLLDQPEGSGKVTSLDAGDSRLSLEAVAGKTVLLVDDSPTNLMLYKSMLDGFELEILTASNGAEAIDIVEEHLPDAILMDLQMPIMNGYEATRRIKEHQTWHKIPVFALSGFSSIDEIPDVHLFDGILKKPVEMDTFIQTVVAMLGGSQLQAHPGYSTPMNRLASDLTGAASEEDVANSLAATVSRSLDSLTSSERGIAKKHLQDIIARTERFRHQQSVSLIEEMGSEVANLAESIQCEPLVALGHNLTRYAATFNLSEMNRQLDHLEELTSLVALD